MTLLSDFGVNDAAARAALSRMVKRQLLVPARTGRNQRACGLGLGEAEFVHLQPDRLSGDPGEFDPQANS